MESLALCRLIMDLAVCSGSDKEGRLGDPTRALRRRRLGLIGDGDHFEMWGEKGRGCRGGELGSATRSGDGCSWETGAPIDRLRYMSLNLTFTPHIGQKQTRLGEGG